MKINISSLSEETQAKIREELAYSYSKVELWIPNK